MSLYSAEWLCKSGRPHPDQLPTMGLSPIPCGYRRTRAHLNWNHIDLLQQFLTDIHLHKVEVHLKGRKEFSWLQANISSTKMGMYNFVNTGNELVFMIDIRQDRFNNLDDKPLHPKLFLRFLSSTMSKNCDFQTLHCLCLPFLGVTRADLQWNIVDPFLIVQTPHF